MISKQLYDDISLSLHDPTGKIIIFAQKKADRKLAAYKSLNCSIDAVFEIGPVRNQIIPI